MEQNHINNQYIRWIFDREKGPISNRVLGTPVNVIEVVLGYSGLLTASDYDFLK